MSSVPLFPSLQLDYSYYYLVNVCITMCATKQTVGEWSCILVEDTYPTSVAFAVLEDRFANSQTNGTVLNQKLCHILTEALE